MPADASPGESAGPSIEAEKSKPRRVVPQNRKQYRNLHGESYLRKLAQVQADIEAGELDRLTLKIGRERYQCGDLVTKRIQVDLAKAGLLVRTGKRYQVCIAA